ncbi:MAG: tetratricopeptide repeat protein [Nitrospinales bacterium]
MRILFPLLKSNLAALVCFLLLSGCFRIPQQELQAAVDPLNDKNYPLAIEKLSQLLERYPKNAQVNYYLAFAHMKNKEHKKALHFLDQVLAFQKDYEAVVGDIKMANFLAGNSQTTRDPFFRLAVLEAQKIIELHPNTEISDRVRFHLGHYYLWKRDYPAAIRIFKQVIDSPPGDTESDRNAYLMLGNVFLRYLDNEAEGLKFHKALMERYPGSDAAVEALFQSAEYNENKMRVYDQRYRALREFAQTWSNDSTLGLEARSARQQSQKDLQFAMKYREKAVAAYRKILDGRGEDAFYARAKTRLDRL